MNVETTTYANGEVAIFLRGKQYKDGSSFSALSVTFLSMRILLPISGSSIKKKRRSRKHRKSWML